MEIKIGDFQITADGTQFTLFKKKKKSDKANNPGEEFYDFCGYYSDFASCLREIPRHALLGSDANTFDEVLYILRDYKRMISQHLEPKIVKVETPVQNEVKMLKRTK